MQVCLYNRSSKPVYVEEIGMTIGAKQKSRVLTDYEREAITKEYPGLLFVDAVMESPRAKNKTDDKDAMSTESQKPKKKTVRKKYAR